MRLLIDATPEELLDKSGALAQALVNVLSPVDADLAEELEKAIPKDVPKLKHKVLRELHEKTREIYEQQMKAMVEEIGKVLDRSVLKKADDDEPGEEPEKLEPGDIDPETGEEVPEEKEPEPEEEEGEEEEST